MSDKNARSSLKEYGYTTSTSKEASREEQERLLEDEALCLLEEARRLETEVGEDRFDEKLQLVGAKLESFVRGELSKWIADAELVETAPMPMPKKKKRARAKLALPAGPRTVARAAFALELLADAVPKRINTEQIGDALERIGQLAAKGSPKWVIYFKVVTTYWWVFLNTLLHYGERIAGIVKVAIGRDDNKE